MNFNLFFTFFIIQTFVLVELISAHPTKYIHRVHRERRSLLKSPDQEQNFNSNLDSEAFQSASTPSSYLDLDKFPAIRMPVQLHSDLSLECQVVGSPAPKIRWLKNGIPLESPHASNHQEHPSFAMSKVKSTLRLQCILPDDEAEYTCVAQNGHKKIMATTQVVIEVNDSSAEIRPECEYRLPMFFPEAGISAYISAVETLHMENLGSDIMLPCQVGGLPKPKISWFDNHGQKIVPSQRFEIFPSGDLLIRDLEWADMGEFSCVAENSFGRDLTSTFVYPLQVQSTEEGVINT